MYQTLKKKKKFRECPPAFEDSSGGQGWWFVGKGEPAPALEPSQVRPFQAIAL
jgi:hypothetical protein